MLKPGRAIKITPARHKKEEAYRMRLILCFLVFSAAVSDVRTGRIPNRLVLAGMLCALAASVSGHSIMAPELLTGMLLPILFPGLLFPLGMIGAGDVKLFCMIGAYLGAEEVLKVIFLSFAFGAVESVAIILACRENGVPFTGFHRLRAYAAGRRDHQQGTGYINLSQRESRICFTPAVFAGLMLYLIF